MNSFLLLMGKLFNTTLLHKGKHKKGIWQPYYASVIGDRRGAIGKGGKDEKCEKGGKSWKGETGGKGSKKHGERLWAIAKGGKESKKSEKYKNSNAIQITKLEVMGNGRLQKSTSVKVNL